MPVTSKLPVGITDGRPYERITVHAGRDMLDSLQRLAPEVVLSQRLYLFADGFRIPATGVDCLR
jgi:hypothetical protein